MRRPSIRICSAPRSSERSRSCETSWARKSKLPFVQRSTSKIVSRVTRSSAASAASGRTQPRSTTVRVKLCAAARLAATASSALLPDEQAAADQAIGDRIELRRAAGQQHRRHDEAPVEDELRALRAFPQLERAGLALLADQLEDVGDAEVAQIPRQADRH